MTPHRRTFEGLSPIELEKQWRKRHARSRRSAFYVRIRIGLIIIFGILVGLIGTWNTFLRVIAGMGVATLPKVTQIEDAQNSLFGVTPAQAAVVAPSARTQLPLQVLGLVISIISLALVLLVIRNVQKYLHERTDIDTDGEHFKPLSEASTKIVDGLLVPLCGRMGIDRARIHLLRPKASRAFSPSMVENPKSGAVLLVVPSDFLTIVTTHEKAAEAMLAHELGHVAQKDSTLWLYASAYTDQLMRYFLPMHIFGLLYSCVTIGTLFVVFGPPNLSLMLVSVYLLLLGLLPLASLLAFNERIRNIRRSSEDLADLAAWLYALPHGVGLQEAFALYDAQKEKVQAGDHSTIKPTPEEEAASFGFFGDVFSKARYFGVHPPIEYRVRQVPPLRQHHEWTDRSFAPDEL